MIPLLTNALHSPGRAKISIGSIGSLLILLTCTYARAQVQPGMAATLPLSITILYFDQSSELLRPRVKTTLDSLARLLIEQRALTATITGYTDNVGKRELNLILAENRAKAVGNYLKSRGVPTTQMSTHWEGPDPNESKVVKTIGRRVVVQLLPR